MNEENYKLTTGFKSYISKPEITALAPSFLVKGSKNVLIDYAKRVVSRNGYTLFGAANTGGGGIQESFDWDTSSSKSFPLRCYDKKVEFYWNSSWNVLRSGLTAVRDFQFAKIWDNTEKIDILLGVNGEALTYKWSGGVSTLVSSTPTTATKQSVLTAKTTIAFNAGTAGLIAPTITDSANGFLNAGFLAGDRFLVTGSVNNSRYYNIGSVTAGTITCFMTDIMTTEVAGPAITLIDGEPTFASSRFLITGTNFFLYNGLPYQYTGGTGTDTLTGIQAVTGVTIGTATITIASPGVVTAVAHGLSVGSIVQFTTTGALPTGLVVGTTYYVIAAGFVVDNFQLSATSGGAAINTTGAQSGVHTLLNMSFPTVAVGASIWQTMTTISNSVAINANFRQDLIAVQLNQLILASTKSQEIYISSTSDYTNFTLTSPRAPGDPAKLTMDNYCTCIVPADNLEQTSSNLIFGGGTSEFFKLSYTLSQDNANELVRMIKLKTSTGSGLVSKRGIGPIKNANVYITREPSLESLGSVENQIGKQNESLSDPIKNDFDNYDFTGTQLKYWKRALYITVPVHGLVLVYDLQLGIWQPPQTIPVSRLAIINDWLHGHSATKNETYRLFSGTDDNGVFIPQVARFAYNNGGNRSALKNMSEYWTDGYISGNGTLMNTLYFGFEGSAGKKLLTISGGDTDIVVAPSGSMLGDEPIGSTPLGGATLGANPGATGATGTVANMLRFNQGDSVSMIDYFEFFAEYSMNTLGGQFAIVAHGSNQWNAGTSPVKHIK